MRTAAEWGYLGHTEAAQIGADADKYRSDQSLIGIGTTVDATLGVAGIKAAAENYGADKTAEASMYGADQTLRGRLAPSFSYSETRAKGGLVAAARPYLVGEKGPELMVPEQSGTIVPNHRLQAILKRKAIPRAEGGRVDAAGISAQNLADWRAGAAPHAEYKKNLMAAATDQKIREAEADARIDPTGARAFHLANAQAPNRIENDAVKTDNANLFNQHYLDTTGAAAVPKAGEPDYPDYHGGVAVAKQFGLEPAKAFQANSQKVKQYAPLFTPDNVSKYRGVSPEVASSFMADLAQNPAAKRKYILDHGPAIKGMQPAGPQPTAGLGGQLDQLLGNAPPYRGGN